MDSILTLMVGIQVAQTGLLAGIFFRLGSHHVRLKILEHINFKKEEKA
ncbi:MAG: hypothetical protein KDJ15_07980 [Alphaproteobacteria bacterium]|nr:hypothetical protein [Alphaproteobacteria bacterium]